MTDVKAINAAVNVRIQDLAIRVTDKSSDNISRDMNELMSLIMPKLRFYIWKFMPTEADTDDVLHDTLVKICASMGAYNINYMFTTWVFTIARNEALSWLNKRPKNIMDIDECMPVLANTMVDNSDSVRDYESTRESVLSDVYEAIQRVSIDEENFSLLEKDINRRKSKDIAVQYNMPENTVKTRIRAGRKRVRDHIMELYPELNTHMVIFEL